jgi:hypothetical protein
VARWPAAAAAPARARRRCGSRRLHSGSARRAPRSLPGRGQKPESRLRDHPLAHLASSRVSWFTWASRSGSSCAPPTSSPPCATAIPPPGGTFGGYEMTPAPACRCTLWQRECAARAPYCLLVVAWRLSDCRSIPFGKYKSASGHFFVCPFRGWVSCLRRFCGTCRAC